MIPIKPGLVSPRPEAAPLEKFQTVMCGKYKISDLRSGGLFKPSRARNLAFFFRSTFSFGERHAKIVLQFNTSRVDRRMAKLLNMLGNGSASPAEVERCWNDLNRACVDLGEVANVKGYQALKDKTAGDAHNHERVSLKPQDKLLEAFKIQLAYLGPLGKQSADDYVARLDRLLGLITSVNATQYAGENVDATQLAYDIGEFIGKAVEAAAAHITTTLEARQSDFNSAHLAPLRQCAVRLHAFRQDLAVMGTVTPQLDGAISWALETLDPAIVKLSTQTLVKSTPDLPDYRRRMGDAVSALRDYDSRQGEAALNEALEQSVGQQFSSLGDKKTVTMLRNAEAGSEQLALDDAQQKLRGLAAANGSPTFSDRFKDAYAHLYGTGSLDVGIDDLDETEFQTVISAVDALRQANISPSTLEHFEARRVELAIGIVHQKIHAVYTDAHPDEFAAALEDLKVPLEDFADTHGVRGDVVDNAFNDIALAAQAARAVTEGSLRSQRDLEIADMTKQLAGMEHDEFVDFLSDAFERDLSAVDRRALDQAVQTRLFDAVDALLDLALTHDAAARTSRVKLKGILSRMEDVLDNVDDAKERLDQAVGDALNDRLSAKDWSPRRLETWVNFHQGRIAQEFDGELAGLLAQLGSKANRLMAARERL